MFTRNLIGSLCVSAFKLTDTHSEMGIWFILQDLSVRTEGFFRYCAPSKPSGILDLRFDASSVGVSICIKTEY